MFCGTAGDVPEAVGVLVLLLPPITVKGSSDVIVVFDGPDDIPDEAPADPVTLERGDVVMVAMVLPSKSEGTVTCPPSSVSCLWLPVKVTIEGDCDDCGELFWEKVKRASQRMESNVPFMVAKLI